MNTAPLQTDRRAWVKIRAGKFTASTNADLMTAPRNKAAREAGEWSETARTLVATKAIEIIKGAEVKSAWDYKMKRGFVLEPAFKYLLCRHWQPVDDCTMQESGIWVATPDGLLRNGEPVDIKSVNEVDVLLFAEDVPDGDWEALKAWNKTYAYQLLTQARVCGSTHANLVYCTDEIKAFALSEEDVQVIHGEGLHDEHGGLIGEACQRLFDEIGTMFTYHFHDAYDDPGFAFVARRFEIPKEEIDNMERALKLAYTERDFMAVKFRAHLTPTAEEVEAKVADLLEGQDIESDEQIDIRRLEAMHQHIQHIPWPTEWRTAQGKHTAGKVRDHISASLAMINGTITKDLSRKPDTTSTNGHQH